MKKIFISIMLATCIAFSGQAQKARNFYNALGSTLLVSDTVTNTATGFVQVDASLESGNVSSVQFIATKISGLVAGTIAIHGSNDGVDYASISSTTFTATDVATQGGIWQFTGSPVRYYRITWTGAGTMAATIKGTIWTNQAQ
ncbi:MAG: hypothetical protein AAB638_00750 [Patescibacteria group bacterium]